MARLAAGWMDMDMDGVVLIRCLDEWMDFYYPRAVGCIPGGVRDLSFFFYRFSHRVFGGFWVPAGTPKSTKNHIFARKDVPGSSFLTIFAAHAFFLYFSSIFLRF